MSVRDDPRMSLKESLVLLSKDDHKSRCDVGFMVLSKNITFGKEKNDLRAT